MKTKFLPVGLVVFAANIFLISFAWADGCFQTTTSQSLGHGCEFDGADSTIVTYKYPTADTCRVSLNPLAGCFSWTNNEQIITTQTWYSTQVCEEEADSTIPVAATRYQAYTYSCGGGGEC